MIGLLSSTTPLDRICICPSQQEPLPAPVINFACTVLRTAGRRAAAVISWCCCFRGAAICPKPCLGLLRASG